MIVVLMGYMGSGKSFIGKELAKKLNYKFIDLDDFIENKEEASITEIFKQKGAIYFRKKESQYLAEIIGSQTEVVLSLGGGTPCYANNLKIIESSPNVKSFYLKASVGFLSKRLLNEKQHRPLLIGIQSTEEMQEFVGKHLFERSPMYSKADYTIINENKDLKLILEEIILSLF